MTKYAGLMLIVDRERELEKRAIFDQYADWSATHPWQSMALSFTPAGAVTQGMDAARAFSQGRIMSGLGNTIGAAASLAFPGAGWLAKGGAKLLGLGRYAPAIGKLPYLNATTASTIGHAGQLASKYSPLTGKILGEGAQAAHNASELTGGGAGLLGGLGLSLLGNHFEGADPAYASQE